MIKQGNIASTQTHRAVAICLNLYQSNTQIYKKNPDSNQRRLWPRYELWTVDVLAHKHYITVSSINKAETKQKLYILPHAKNEKW